MGHARRTAGGDRSGVNGALHGNLRRPAAIRKVVSAIPVLDRTERGSRTCGWLRCPMMRTGRWSALWLMLTVVAMGALNITAFNIMGVAVAAEPETLAISPGAPVTLGAGPVTVTLGSAVGQSLGRARRDHCARPQNLSRRQGPRYRRAAGDDLSALPRAAAGLRAQSRQHLLCRCAEFLQCLSAAERGPTRGS